MDLKEIRFRKNITQWELAFQSGVPQSRISLVENGYPASDREKFALINALQIKDSEIDWPKQQNRRSE